MANCNHGPLHAPMVGNTSVGICTKQHVEVAVIHSYHPVLQAISTSASIRYHIPFISLYDNAYCHSVCSLSQDHCWWRLEVGGQVQHCCLGLFLFIIHLLSYFFFLCVLLYFHCWVPFLLCLFCPMSTVGGSWRLEVGIQQCLGRFFLILLLLLSIPLLIHPLSFILLLLLVSSFCYHRLGSCPCPASCSSCILLFALLLIHPCLLCPSSSCFFVLLCLLASCRCHRLLCYPCCAMLLVSVFLASSSELVVVGLTALLKKHSVEIVLKSTGFVFLMLPINFPAAVLLSS